MLRPSNVCGNCHCTSVSCQNIALNLSKLRHKNYILSRSETNPQLLIISLHSKKQHMPVVRHEAESGNSAICSQLNQCLPVFGTISSHLCLSFSGKMRNNKVLHLFRTREALYSTDMTSVEEKGLIMHYSDVNKVTCLNKVYYTTS